jgi:hypothetical protein
MCVPNETKAITCPPGKVLNEAGTACIDETIITAKPESCPIGTKLNLETGDCDPIEDDDGTPIVNCPEGYLRNLVTGKCEKIKDNSCPTGQVRNAEGKCVPIVKGGGGCPPGYESVNGVCVPVCQPGYQRVNGVCKKITADTVIPTPTPSGLNAQGERIDPIYAGAMDDFDLFATLEELLNENSEPKKDSKKSKDKTKMATGGHLDDLLAEQMTVDDLLKLLR